MIEKLVKTSSNRSEESKQKFCGAIILKIVAIKQYNLKKLLNDDEFIELIKFSERKFVPVNFLCKVMIPVKSILSSSVCSKTLILSSIQVTVSRHSIWNVCTPWAEASSSLLASDLSRKSPHLWLSWFWRPTISSLLKRKKNHRYCWFLIKYW